MGWFRDRVAAYVNRRSYYLRMVATYGLLTVVAILVSSFALVAHAHAFLRGEIEESDRRLLAQARILTDRGLLTHINSLINAQFLHGSGEPNLARFVLYGTEGRPDLLYHVSTDLTALALSSELFRSVAAYRTRDDTLVSSEGGVYLRVSERLDPAPDKERLDAARRSLAEGPARVWIGPDPSSGRPTLTCAQSLPLYAPRDSREGLVLFHVDLARLAAALRAACGLPSHGRILVLDGGGRLMADSSLDRTDGTPWERPFTPAATPQGFAVIRAAGEYLGASWTRSEISDWTYVSLTPIRSFDHRLRLMRNLAIAVSLVAAALAFGALALVAVPVYRPLQRLLDISRLHGRTQGPVGDLELIGRTITGLAGQVDEMQRSLEANRGLVEHRAVTDVLFGKVGDEAAIAERLALVGLTSRRPALLVVDLDREAYGRLAYPAREYATLKLTELLCAGLGPGTSVVSYRPGSLAVLLDRPLSPSEVAGLLAAAEAALALRCNAALCSARPLTSLAAAFETARLVEKYAGIQGYGHVFTEERLAALERSAPALDLHRLARIEAFFRGGRVAELERTLLEAVAEARQRGLSAAYVESLFSHVAGVVGETMGGEDDRTPAAAPPATDLGVISAERFVAEIVRLAGLHRDLAAARGARIDTGFPRRIADYVSRNVDANTSLATVADKFHISPGHLSRLFKDGNGIHFQDFLLEARLHKAREMLLEQRRPRVAAVARSLGYSNTSYFARLFRSRFGAAPLQYRKQHAAEAAPD